MLIEKWVQWKPIANLSAKYYLKSFLSNFHTFEFTLVSTSDNTDILRVDFQNSSRFSQKINICFKQKTFRLLQEQHGSSFLTWSFFKVTNLEYAQLLEKHSAGFYTAKEFTHFVFIIGNEMLEILGGADDPKITKIPK